MVIYKKHILEDNMKKYDLILKLSFIPCFLILYACDYVTAQTWADIIFYFFLGAVLYQLCYLFYLKKKGKVSFLRSFAKILLYYNFIVSTSIIIFYVDIYFNGYTWSFLEVSRGPYYGLEAWKHATWESMLAIPLFCIVTIYEICYFISSKKIRNSLKQNNND